MQEQIAFKNTQICFNEQGKGAAVVLLHGFLENSSMWKNITSELSKKYRVISIDLLGHGKSENLGYIHSMEDMATAVKTVLDALKIRKAMFIGHSMGGYVALAFADLFSKNTKGICLLNSTPINDSAEKVIQRNRAVVALKQQLTTFIKIAIPNLFAPASKDVFIEEITIVIAEALTTSKQGAVAATEGMKTRKNYQEFFSKSTLKKMVILGREDPVLDLKNQLEIYKNTDIPTTILEGGHMSHIESFEALMPVLKKFLK